MKLWGSHPLIDQHLGMIHVDCRVDVIGIPVDGNILTQLGEAVTSVVGIGRKLG
jgi:hypothetical protein